MLIIARPIIFCMQLGVHVYIPVVKLCPVNTGQLVIQACLIVRMCIGGHDQ